MLSWNVKYGAWPVDASAGLLVSAVRVIISKLTTMSSAAPTHTHFCQKVNGITPFPARFPMARGHRAGDRGMRYPRPLREPWRHTRQARRRQQVYSVRDRCYNLAVLN